MSVPVYDLSDLRHLPGQHDQKTHGSGGGSGAPAGGSGGAVMGAADARQAVAAEIGANPAASVFTLDDRADAKRLVEESVLSRMTDVPTTALVAERRDSDAQYGGELALRAEPDGMLAYSAMIVGRAPNGDLEMWDIGTVDDVAFTLRQRGWKGEGDPTLKDVREYLTNPDGTLDIYDGQWALPGSPAAERMVRGEAVSSLVDTWAATSNDSNPRSLAIQEAAAAEFGITGATEWTGPVTAIEQETGRIYGAHGDVYRAYLRAQYEGTQEWFADRGVGSVTLYRGVGTRATGVADHSDGATTSVRVRPLSSWSYEAGTAEEFAGSSGHRLKVTVPVSRILSVPTTGVGCLAESEMVVVGPTFDGVEVMAGPEADDAEVDE